MPSGLCSTRLPVPTCTYSRAASWRHEVPAARPVHSLGNSVSTMCVAQHLEWELRSEQVSLVKTCAQVRALGQVCTVLELELSPDPDPVGQVQQSLRVEPLGCLPGWRGEKLQGLLQGATLPHPSSSTLLPSSRPGALCVPSLWSNRVPYPRVWSELLEGSSALS